MSDTSDTREQALLREVRRNRERLAREVDAFSQTVRVGLDPLRRVRRNPIESILASAAGGLLLSGLAGLVGNRYRPADNGDGKQRGMSSTLWSLVSSVVPAVFPLLLNLISRANPGQPAHPPD